MTAGKGSTPRRLADDAGAIVRTGNEVEAEEIHGIQLQRRIAPKPMATIRSGEKLGTWEELRGQASENRVRRSLQEAMAVEEKKEGDDGFARNEFRRRKRWGQSEGGKRKKLLFSIFFLFNFLLYEAVIKLQSTEEKIIFKFTTL